MLCELKHQMFCEMILLCFLINFILTVDSRAPLKSVVVFSAGEGGYYCHKIPYLFRTTLNTLIAFAEARGKNQDSCNDFTGHIIISTCLYKCPLMWIM